MGGFKEIDMPLDSKYTTEGTIVVRPGGQYVGNAASETDAIGLAREMNDLRKSLRDDFATAAMSGLLANNDEDLMGDMGAYDDCASTAYLYADWMMHARESPVYVPGTQED